LVIVKTRAMAVEDISVSCSMRLPSKEHSRWATQLHGCK
jgi:hypothetical protein